MTDPKQRPQSHLFTVRIWAEPQQDHQTEWRGKIKHIPSGTAYYFREWDTLVKRIKQILDKERNA